jgi:hypothetical protein
MEDTKSGRRTKEKAWSTYQTACEKGYEGDLSDWYHLVGIRPRR